MEIKQITNINEALKILWEHDQSSQKINFPKDKPNRKISEERILKEYDEEPTGYFFIYEDGKIVGSLILKTRFNPFRNQKYGDVRAIYFDDSCRGKGFGSKALEFADEYFKLKGCAYAFAGVSALNPASNALFDKFGYERTRNILEKQYES